VLVRDMMQRVGDWRVIDIRDIEPATVASVARRFAATEISHVPVIEWYARGQQRLRGMLSAARVKRLLDG
jgi:hypothetical protein